MTSGPGHEAALSRELPQLHSESPTLMGSAIQAVAREKQVANSPSNSAGAGERVTDKPAPCRSRWQLLGAP